MSNKVTATFATRRDAEMAIEHIVQEHGLDRKAISVLPDSSQNSSGTSPAGGDLQSGDPELAGRLSVTATVDDALLEKVRSSFATYGGKS